MKIVAFIKYKKLTTGLLVGGMALALAVGSFILGSQWHSSNINAKVDRSNAIQVAKPVQTEQVIPVVSPDFFIEYRLERDKIRSERSDLLRESIKSAANDDARQKAQDVMLKMVMEKQRETEIESLVKARGFAD
ncbi:MAG: SpoIIIAH-like family protein, partial [Negativicutes bacterium]|nr:SpoIIIAH-like family protein [Negativicutes bacterium]